MFQVIVKDGNFVTIFDLDKKPARYFFYTFENFHIIFKSYFGDSLKKIRKFLNFTLNSRVLIYNRFSFNTAWY